MSNKHSEIKDAKIHVAKGFASGIGGTVPWRNERGLQSFEAINSFPKAISLVASNVAPPTEVNGAIYLIDGARGILDVNIIAWQSGTTIRYTFSGTPNLSAYVVGDYILFANCTKAINNGSFAITAFNDGADWIEVSNISRTSATDDEAAGSPGTATSTLSNWDGCPQNSWARFNSIDVKWYSVSPAIGTMCFNTALGYHMYYNGTEWVSVGTSDLTSVIFTVKITWTTGDLLAGFGTPKTTVAAVSGYAIRVVDESFALAFNTTAYSVSAIMETYTDIATIAQTNTTILNATATTHRFATKQAVTGVADTQIIAGRPVFTRVKTANPTLGNSGMVQYIDYRLVKI